MAVPVQREVRSVRRKAEPPLNYPSTPDFIYMVSLSDIEFVDGEPLPRLIRARVYPGVNGVKLARHPDDPVSWEGPMAELAKRTGRLIVNPQQYGIVPKVRGEEYHPADDEDPTNPSSWYVQRFPGRHGPVYVSIWQSPRILGDQVLWEVDREGEIDFRRQIVLKMFPGGKVDEQVASNAKFATEQALAAAGAAARTDPRGVYNVEVLQKALGMRKKSKLPAET